MEVYFDWFYTLNALNAIDNTKFQIILLRIGKSMFKSNISAIKQDRPAKRLEIIRCSEQTC